MEIKPGDVFVQDNYKMTVREVKDGIVVWDGIYNVGYETPLHAFLSWVKGEKPDLSGNVCWKKLEPNSFQETVPC